MYNLNIYIEDQKLESKKESEDGLIKGKGLKDRLVNSDNIFLKILI